MRETAWQTVRRITIELILTIPVMALAGAGIARAGVAGPKIVTAQGGVIDYNGDTGHIAIGGLAVLNNKGGATSLNLTIAYHDNYGDSGILVDNVICAVTTPTDLSYSITNGVGTATLTLSSSDTCFETVNPLNTVSNSGNSITFNVYALGSKLLMVGTGSSTLRDGAGDTLDNMAIAGEIDAASAGSAQASGVRFVSGEGGMVDSTDGSAGHMALGGLMQLTPVSKKVTTGTAKSLDVTLSFEDPDPSGNLTCQFTDPTDVSYALTKGVGSLILTVGSGDTCTQGGSPVTETGKWISFNLYAAGASGRLVTTGSTLVNSSGHQLIPAAAASFSTAGGF